jgi:hypothetical protein
MKNSNGHYDVMVSIQAYVDTGFLLNMTEGITS